MRKDGRGYDALRPVSLETGWKRQGDGSVLYAEPVRAEACWSSPQPPRISARPSMARWGRWVCIVVALQGYVAAIIPPVSYTHLTLPTSDLV